MISEFNCWHCGRVESTLIQPLVTETPESDGRDYGRLAKFEGERGPHAYMPEAMPE